MFVFLDVLLGPSVDRSYLAGPDAAVAPVQWETTAPGHLRRVGILFHSVDCSNSYCIINVIVEEVYNIILHPKQSQVPFLNQQKRQIFSLSPALSLSLSNCQIQLYWYDCVARQYCQNNALDIQYNKM